MLIDVYPERNWNKMYLFTRKIVLKIADLFESSLNFRDDFKLFNIRIQMK